MTSDLRHQMGLRHPVASWYWRISTSSSRKFSKVSSKLIPYCKSSCQLTFENFYQLLKDVRAKKTHANWRCSKITDFMITDFMSHYWFYVVNLAASWLFWEFLPGPSERAGGERTSKLEILKSQLGPAFYVVNSVVSWLWEILVSFLKTRKRRKTKRISLQIKEEACARLPRLCALMLLIWRCLCIYICRYNCVYRYF